MVDWTRVRKMVTSPIAFTIAAERIPSVGGSIVPTKTLFPTAAKKAPTPSPKRGSTWIGLIKKTMNAIATEAKRAWNILMYNCQAGGGDEHGEDEPGVNVRGAG